MEVHRQGPVNPGDIRARADDARRELVNQVRGRTVAAREELERYRHLLAEKTRVERQDVRVEDTRRDAPDAVRARRRASEGERAGRGEPDRIELSERARLLARESAADRASRLPDDASAERLRMLAAEHREGRLDRPERIERAARRLLGDES